MKTKFVLILLTVGVIFGCPAAFGQRLYPVRGPLASLKPPPVFTGRTIKGLTTDRMSLILADGESFKGDVTFVHASFANTRTAGASASYPPQINLEFAWDAICGQGYYVANVLGKSIGRHVFIGNRGTVLQVEFLDGKFGVAVDNKGNMYKMAF
jgi:hypothetical protein